LKGIEGGKSYAMVVHAIPVNAEGMILIQQRSFEKTIWPGRWALMGGHAEAGETPDETLLREFKEEYGVDISEAPRFMVCRMIHDLAQVTMEFWLVMADIAIQDVVCQPSEVEQAAYVTPEELHTIYSEEARWTPGEERARKIVLDLFSRLPEMISEAKKENATEAFLIE
jgi:8-oxo-dGTP pyrophosphatase MutT (NUDIX family)